MPSFRYTALNRQKKQVSGVIQAATEHVARKRLNELGFSILSITEERDTASAAAATGKRFAFEAIDQSKKAISGTIIAGKELEAYQRLVEEYGFTVQAIYAANATPEEKELARREGVAALQTQPQEIKEGQEEATEEVRRKALLAQVNFALHKVDALLTRYGEELKPETKRLIKAAVDRLLRIRSSTNLDYIENSTETLLRLIQDEELFLHREQFQKERRQIALETEQIVMDLHKARKTTGKNLHHYWETQAKKTPETVKEKVLHAIAIFIVKRWTVNPELQRINDKKRLLRKQMIAAFHIILTTKNRGLREEAWKSVGNGWHEYDRLRQEARQLRIKQKEERRQQRMPNAFLRELNLLTGCLLFFYLAYYLLTAQTAAKGIVIPYLTPLLIQHDLLVRIVLLLFLLHAGTSVSITYFPNAKKTRFLAIPTALLLYALFRINL